MELCWLTCVSSALNGEELTRSGGVATLGALLMRCFSVLPQVRTPLLYLRPLTVSRAHLAAQALDSTWPRTSSSLLTEQYGLESGRKRGIALAGCHADFARKGDRSVARKGD